MCYTYWTSNYPTKAVLLYSNGAKMKIIELGNNQTELLTNHGHRILYSYETPVAGFSPEIGYFKSTEHYSRTTSKHINQYLKGVNAVLLPPEAIEELFTKMIDSELVYMGRKKMKFKLRDQVEEPKIEFYLELHNGDVNVRANGLLILQFKPNGTFYRAKGIATELRRLGFTSNGLGEIYESRR